MSESVYKIIEMVGSSPVSWKEATKNAVKTAGCAISINWQVSRT